MLTPWHVALSRQLRARSIRDLDLGIKGDFRRSGKTAHTLRRVGASNGLRQPRRRNNDPGGIAVAGLPRSGRIVKGSHTEELF
jgi:hypothetical protein